MNHVNVSSSNIRSVGYDCPSSTLEIRFRNGGVYQYYGVPSGVHAGLMRAPSKGRYFHAFIRDRYPDRRVA